jgi:DNA-binding CsgD family transcriptional regulator
MVQINFAQKTVNVKIVYYGPGMSGKTPNLEVVHQRAPDTNKGELTSISTDGDRTLFFDYMPLDLGTVAGMRTCFQCYTVPGQVYYNSTRKLVLQGVDGVIFVADSAASMLDQNIESLRNLEENLNDITSPYMHGISTKYLKLTPTEINVANLVKQGKTTKEISDLLHMSTRTIDAHRYSIRRKLGLTNKKENLRTYLLSTQ